MREWSFGGDWLLGWPGRAHAGVFWNRNICSRPLSLDHLIKSSYLGQFVWPSAGSIACQPRTDLPTILWFLDPFRSISAAFKARFLASVKGLEKFEPIPLGISATVLSTVTSIRVPWSKSPLTTASTDT